MYVQEFTKKKKKTPYPNVKELKGIATSKTEALQNDGIIAKNIVPPELIEEESRLALEAGIDFEILRKQTVIKYDIEKYKFQEAIAEALAIPKEFSTKLGSLHETSLLPVAEASSGRGYRGHGTEWIKRWKSGQLINTPQHCNQYYSKLYLKLLQELILPYINDPRGICFQRDPTFRCHIAGDPLPTGRVHCDADYGHSTAEINFWIPFSSTVYGSNSIYCESAPGAGDYNSFDMEYGEIMCFWGSQCNHYTVPNTSNVTRISVDFRVLPRSLYDMTDMPGSHFAIGGFFGHMFTDPEGNVVIQ